MLLKGREKMTELTIRNDEQVVFVLRSLYETYGYKLFKMTKFEEYDLYVKNKDFLICDNIITFNDTNGRLMALKPDVTLSIIKNKSEKGSLKKVYYNENVYRVSKGTNSFKEIMQVGLECIGDVDSYCISEVLTLACESLCRISDRCVLSISDLDIIFEIFEKENIDPELCGKLLELMGSKNVHELCSVCKENKIGDETVSVLCEMINLFGCPDRVFAKLNKLLPNNEKVRRFESTVESVNEKYRSMIEIDFSTVGDSKYYNGIAFKGFVDGVSGSVLSGGQYDKLMKKMKHGDKAIGFAIYLDMLEFLNEAHKEYDVDIALLYQNGCDVKKLNEQISALTDSGNTVIALKSIPDDLKYRKLMIFKDGEAKNYEDNA